MHQPTRTEDERAQRTVEQASLFAVDTDNTGPGASSSTLYNLVLVFHRCFAEKTLNTVGDFFLVGLTLRCPIRGVLKASAKSADGLKPSEEYFRVEAIRHLLRLGYPSENIKVEATVKKFGNAGRNAMRADLAVLDIPVAEMKSGDVDSLLEHAIVLVEVKRDNAAADYVKNTQVHPLLDFAKRDDCLAVYWDNVDQRVFWQEREGGVRSTKEGPIQILPRYGNQIHLSPLKFDDLNAADSLVDVFDRIENVLHAASIDHERRFSVILQLILAKLYDEHAHQRDPDAELLIQDYAALGGGAATALKAFNGVLSKAVAYYQAHLPQPVEKSLPKKVTGELLCEICRSLAPVCLIASKRDVVQSFYMKFSKGLYKWDLAQYFTPPSVTDYIVSILNPQFGEHIKDPACGSADFLTAAFHRRRDIDPGYADCIWGMDNSENAVQVAVLNMLLNGDGKSNIKEGDSLLTVTDDAEQYSILVCNPPFGLKIVEKRSKVLRKFDLGHQWSYEEKSGRWLKHEVLAPQVETGLLFAELCVRQAHAGGRIGIIFPNGYLGNRSPKYQVFRDWLLRHTRIAAVCAFPRFTFKTSGADVSASIVYLEKRDTPLSDVADDSDYKFSVQMIENVGWNLGDKKAAPRFVRNPEDGSYLIDEDGERFLDADFEKSLHDLRSSEAVAYFPWLLEGQAAGEVLDGWSVPISRVLTDSDLTLDPKRHCRKFCDIRAQIELSDHLRLGDLVSFVPEMQNRSGDKLKRQTSEEYDYVELQFIGQGDYRAQRMRGWELPQRAKHVSEGGEIFIGAIWSSVQKWCVVPIGANGTIVTNGCHRLAMQDGKEDFIVDLAAFLCSESYTSQMRAFARGSDGLAEITTADAADVLVPILSDKDRAAVKPYVDGLLAGQPDISAKVNRMILNGGVNIPGVQKRTSHVALV